MASSSSSLFYQLAANTTTSLSASNSQTGGGTLISIEDRPDYMLEAFLEEQTILIKPLLLRRLTLLTFLELKTRELSSKRDLLYLQVQHSATPNKSSSTSKNNRSSLAAAANTSTVQAPPKQSTAFAKLQSELESVDKLLLDLADEKICVTRQLQDLASRQLETVLEVESALEIAVRKEKGFLGDEGGAGSTSGLVGGGKMMKKHTSEQTSSHRIVIGSASSHHLNEADEFGESGVGDTKESRIKQNQVGEDIDDIWCYCRKPDDGRPMIACDNTSSCSLLWWHIDCVQKYIDMKGIGSLPENEDAPWICPVCLESRKTAGARKRLKTSNIS